MENGYNKTLTIDRINVNDGYCPNNCRWVDRIVQNNNRRNNKTYEINGVHKTARQWCTEFGKPYELVIGRLKRGVCIETALFHAKNKTGKRLEVISNIHDKAQQKQALIDTMRGDEEIGLYDDNPKKITDMSDNGMQINTVWLRTH